MIRSARTTSWAVFCTLLAAQPARAHGFGERYDLPLPLGIWMTGAGASIVLSFVIVSVLDHRSAGRKRFASRDLLGFPGLRALSSVPVVGFVRCAALGLWLLTIAAGLYGVQDSYRNIAPTLVWVIGWVGISFASIFLGDVWATFHPLRSALGWADTFAKGLLGRPLIQSRELPRGTGVWPGLLAFAAFAWMELVYAERDVPLFLGRALAVYSVVTLVGMSIYGRTRWLEHAEFLSIAFGILGRFAPFEMRPTTERGARTWRLRAPGIGLLDGLPLSLSHALFITVMLSTVTFDGFLETRQWVELADRMSISAWMQPILEFARGVDLSDEEAITSIGFLAFPALFASALFCTASLSRRVVLGPGGAAPADVASSSQIACTLVATLVPIAIAYHLAHYLSMFAISGQYLIALASDPFGFGWDLFGSAGYRVDVGVIGVRFVWYTAASAIVTGHVASVVLAHILARGEYALRRAVVWSQIPFLGLMVGYTLLSLWILAQPIVD